MPSSEKVTIFEVALLLQFREFKLLGIKDETIIMHWEVKESQPDLKKLGN